jgi:hypothetical protein
MHNTILKNPMVEINFILLLVVLWVIFIGSMDRGMIILKLWNIILF